MSFDFKLMFLFHGCMMILFIGANSRAPLNANSWRVKKNFCGLTGGKYLINAHTGNGLITSLAANWEFASR
jgi:hypothetical protein